MLSLTLTITLTVLTVLTLILDTVVNKAPTSQELSYCIYETCQFSDVCLVQVRYKNEMNVRDVAAYRSRSKSNDQASVYVNRTRRSLVEALYVAQWLLQCLHGSVRRLLCAPVSNVDHHQTPPRHHTTARHGTLRLARVTAAGLLLLRLRTHTDNTASVRPSVRLSVCPSACICASLSGRPLARLYRTQHTFVLRLNIHAADTMGEVNFR